MEKLKELLEEAFEAGMVRQDCVLDPCLGDAPNFEEWFSNNSAQVEALSVGNNEGKKKICLDCSGNGVTGNMGDFPICKSCNGTGQI